MAQPNEGRTEGVSVLVVEDEALIAFFLEDTLDELGYRCCGIADSADEALTLARAERPAVALVDVGLRGNRDGVEVANALTALGVVVIFLTGSGDLETRQRLAAAQPHGIIAKPCNHQDIARMLESAQRAVGQQ